MNEWLVKFYSKLPFITEVIFMFLEFEFSLKFIAKQLRLFLNLLTIACFERNIVPYGIILVFFAVLQCNDTDFVCSFF